jgi:hypothetical protein
MFDRATTLPYDRVLAIDFEYEVKVGNPPIPVCLVVKDLKDGSVARYWRDDLEHMKTPPFDTGGKTLIVAYYAPAEMLCFRVLGWPMPQRLIDLYVEFRLLTNGQDLPSGAGLVGALRFFELDDFVPLEKGEIRQLILSGGPWTECQQARILDYCLEDVTALGPLLDAVLARSPWSKDRLEQALARGLYMYAVGVMEHNGIPIDMVIYNRLRTHWETIKRGLITETDRDFGVYQDGSFKELQFERYLYNMGVPWPRLGSGKLALDRDTFSRMSKTYPVVKPLHDLRTTLSELKLNGLTVGADGRNRAMLSPFRAKTGRNQPSTTKFVFGPSRWFRGLIKPPEGMALAYCDWSSQEIAIAGALSGDELLWEAYASGDPYMTFAIQAGLAPKGATKETHKAVRNRCKQVVLGTNYGMSAHGVAQAAGISVLEAQSLLQRHRETYQKFWCWAEDNKNTGLLGKPLTTPFGWRIQVESGTPKANTFLNWPMQANGAEMMRFACSFAVQRGIKLCAPIHDALLIEASIEQIDAEVERLKGCMTEASELVLGDGKICRVDADIIRYPDRFMDEGGSVMWQTVTNLLDNIES